MDQYTKLLLAHTTPREAITRLCDLLAEARARNVRVENALIEIRELIRERDPALAGEIDKFIRHTGIRNEDYKPDEVNFGLQRGS